MSGPGTIKLRVPELGDFKDVEVIEILVQPGDEVSIEDPLLTLETDKASLDVPASDAGTVISVDVAVGDRINSGDAIVTIETASAVSSSTDSDSPAEPEETGEDEAVTTRVMSREEVAIATGAKPRTGSAAADASAPHVDDEKKPEEPAARSILATHKAQLVVIGAGPGGYTAAFRAADLGMDVLLVERWPMLGGVCLNVGCIPSKALLHAAKVIDDAAAMAVHGVQFGAPEVDANKLGAWKNNVVERLVGGLTHLAKQRKVRVVHGHAQFASANRLVLDSGDTIAFERCIIAAGSEPAMLPGLPNDPRIIDSTGALALESIPGTLLVVGGGIIGLEMACVYAALGSEVSVVELTNSLMPGTDPDLLRPFLKIVKPRYKAIMTGTKVTGMQPIKAGIEVAFDGKDGPSSALFDKVLIAVGRRANGDKLAAEKAGIEVDKRGIIAVDRQMRTNIPHIFAVGDLAGGPMLAHKATHEAKVAAEVAAGEKSYFDARCIPSVAYTDPEIAWTGLTETEAKEQGVDYEKTSIPWAASGRALSLGRDEGFTKLLFDKKTGQVLGGAIVGPNAGDLITEVSLAIEMGADAEDISLTIHPHPTLSETVAFAAEAFAGTLTDLYLPRKKSG
ncbi:MAG TPA: dihydrolipoyl dehydrogenase [Woeseiaceae bacterium]|nr:dihydrolipoyl dehydrogenase [Woeseiaceae bacterium]